MSRDTALLAALRPLDGGSGVPGYRQIADQLERALDHVEVGSRVPSEAEIAGAVQVSRGTAVQALRELVRRELVTRVQGRGTFKAAPSPGRFTRLLGAPRLPSFTQDLRDAGHRTREDVRECALVPAPEEVVAALALEPGGLVWRVERTLLADEIPVVHLVSWVHAGHYPQLEPEQIGERSLYGHLADRYGETARPAWADEEYTAEAADEVVAGALGMARGRPVLCSRRIAYLADGPAVELVRSAMRADAYSVRVTLLPGEQEHSDRAGLALRAEMP